jgi:hypothetical protein
MYDPLKFSKRCNTISVRFLCFILKCTSSYYDIMNKCSSEDAGNGLALVILFVRFLCFIIKITTSDYDVFALKPVIL